MTVVMISGANGFIGKKLVRSLSYSGYQVIAVVRNLDNSNELERYAAEVIEWFEKPRLTADVFIHLAWENSSGPLRGDWDAQLENIALQTKAQKWANSLGVKNFVGVGTITELEAISAAHTSLATAKKNPAYVYGLMKDKAREIGANVAKSLNMNFQWLRLGNIYGLKDDTGRFFVRTLEKIMQNEDLDLTDGLQLSDFIFESDAMNAIDEAITQGDPNGIYYVGAGQSRTLRSVVELMKEIAKSSSQLNFGAIASSGKGLSEENLSIEPLLEKTNYSPEVSLLTGIELCIRDMQSS